MQSAALYLTQNPQITFCKNVYRRLYSEIIYEIAIEAEKRKAQPKYIAETDDNSCVISMEEIKENDYYYKCPQCTAIYDVNSLKEWIENRPYDKPTCPHCKCVYQQYPQMLINIKSASDVNNSIANEYDETDELYDIMNYKTLYNDIHYLLTKINTSIIKPIIKKCFE